MATVKLQELVIEYKVETGKAQQQLGQFDAKLAKTGSTAGTAGKQVGGLGSAFSSMVNPVTLAIGAVTAIGAGILKLGTDSQKATSKISTATGATGAELDKLRGSFDNAFGQVPDQMGLVATAFSSLQTLTGATGKTLEDLTVTVLDASRALGEDAAANANALGTALKQFKEPAENGELAMDQLFVASQKFDVGIGKLLGSVNTYGAVLSNAGVSMQQSIELFGSLESAGISVSRVMPGLNKFFRDTAAAGGDLQGGLRAVVTSMKEAETSADALTIATKAFGAEGAQRMTTAVRAGVLELEDLGAALDGAGGQVAKFTEQNKTLGESFSELTNKVTLLVTPLGDKLVSALMDVVDLLNAASDSSKSFGERISAMHKVTGEWSTALRILGGPLGGLAQGIEKLNELFGIQEDKTKASAAAVKADAAAWTQYFNITREGVPGINKVTEGLDKQTAAAKKAAEAAEAAGRAVRTMIAEMNKSRVEELNTALDDTYKEIGKIAKAAPSVGVLGGVAVDVTKDIKLLESALDSVATAVSNVTVTFPELSEVGTAGLGEIAGAATKVQEPMIQVSTIVTDLSAGLADIILEGKGVAEAFAEIGKAIIRHIIESGLTEYLDSVLGKLPKLGGIFGGGGGGGSNIPGIGGGDSSGGGLGSLASGGVVGMVTGAVSAVSGVVGNFQFAAMNKSLDLIETEVRFTKLYTADIRITGFVLAERLDLIANFLKYVQPSLDSMVQSNLDILSQLRAGVPSAGGTVAVAGPVETVPAGSPEAARLGPRGYGSRARQGLGRGSPLVLNPGNTSGLPSRSPRGRGGMMPTRQQLEGTGNFSVFSRFGTTGPEGAAGRTESVSPGINEDSDFVKRMRELQSFAAANAGSAFGIGSGGLGPLVKPMMEQAELLGDISDGQESGFESVTKLLQAILEKDTTTILEVDGEEIARTVMSHTDSLVGAV